jgi:hypothetical protein
MHSIRPRDLTLRCYAEREAPELWVAICLDFDLAAQGETFEDARARLEAQMSQDALDVSARQWRMLTAQWASFSGKCPSNGRCLPSRRAWLSQRQAVNHQNFIQ